MCVERRCVGVCVCVQCVENGWERNRYFFTAKWSLHFPLCCGLQRAQASHWGFCEWNASSIHQKTTTICKIHLISDSKMSENWWIVQFAMVSWWIIIGNLREWTPPLHIFAAFFVVSIPRYVFMLIFLDDENFLYLCFVDLSNFTFKFWSLSIFFFDLFSIFKS